MRIKKLQEIMKKKKIDLCLFFSLNSPNTNIVYFSSYIGKGIFVITKSNNFLIVPEYEKEKTKNLDTKIHYVEKTKFLLKELSNQIKNKVIKPGTDKSSIIRSTIEYFLHSDQKNLDTHYNYYGRTRLKVFFYYLNSYLKTKYRKSFIDKTLKKIIPITHPFVYFPLHIEIERATLITAPFFTNQIEVIKTISKSLPINFKLYVKEHPAQVTRDWRSISNYKELMKIPNVEILHPDVSNKSIYEKCSLVITIAGSSGFEASFYGKPTITFSSLNYSILPFIYKIQNLDDLPSLILKAIDTNVDSSIIANYIDLLKKNSSKFDWVDFNTKIKDEFFYGGNLIDVEISESKMHSFLKKNFSIIEVLADDHIDKITTQKN